MVKKACATQPKLPRRHFHPQEGRHTLRRHQGKGDPGLVMIKEWWSLNDQIFGPAIHCTSVLAASAARSGRQTGDVSVRPWTAIRPNSERA
jgi:hypothetical protein